jgi:hypothetical protein
MLTRRRFCRSLPAAGLGLLGLSRGVRAAAAANSVAMQAAWVNDAEFIGYFVALQKWLLQGPGRRHALSFGRTGRDS